MFVTWVRIGGKFRGIGGFAGYFGLTALSLALVLFKGKIPDLFTVVDVNALMLAGMIILARGMARFLNLPMSIKPYILLFMAFILLYVWFALVNTNVRMRIMIFSGTMIPIQVHLLKAEENQRRHAFNTGITTFLFLINFLFKVFLCFFLS